MLAADYYDWSKLSGLYGGHSSAERYATYRPLLSEAGLNVVIVSAFLKINPDELSPVDWRAAHVGEDRLQQIIEDTSKALQAMGATRMAAVVQTVEPMTSPREIAASLGDLKPEELHRALLKGVKEAEAEAKRLAATCEKRAEIEELLKKYAQAHHSDLVADIARHGDPRTRPGYTREKRLAELAELQDQLLRKEYQQELAPELVQATNNLKTALAKAVGDAKALKRVASSGRKFRELLKNCREISPEYRTPAVSKALKAAEKLFASHAEFFHPPVTKDPTLNARLAAIGTFETESDSGRRELTWESPKRFSGRWGNHRLCLEFPPGNTKALAYLLQIAEAVRSQLPRLSKLWQSEMIDIFRTSYVPQMSGDELEGYDVDKSGEITDKSILDHAEPGMIHLYYERGEYVARTYYRVAWDPEHGYEIEWDTSLLQSLLKAK